MTASGKSNEQPSCPPAELLSVLDFAIAEGSARRKRTAAGEFRTTKKPKLHTTLPDAPGGPASPGNIERMAADQQPSRSDDSI